MAEPRTTNQFSNFVFSALVLKSAGKFAVAESHMRCKVWISIQKINFSCFTTKTFPGPKVSLPKRPKRHTHCPTETLPPSVWFWRPRRTFLSARPPLEVPANPTGVTQGTGDRVFAAMTDMAIRMCSADPADIIHRQSYYCNIIPGKYDEIVSLESFSLRP